MIELDPRQARTRAALHRSVLETVERMPLADVSVAAIARAAGISRDTFYRHASSVADVLAGALGERLDATVAEFAAFQGGARERFERGERRLFAHVAEHRAVYLNAMAPGLAEPVRAMLVGRIEQALAEYLDTHPEVAPIAAGHLSRAEHHALYAAYGAAGTVGVIEHWLRAGAAGDADDIARSTLAVSAPWWWAD
ncbi:TetR/AcrR family transcriptional regulator [Agromyces bracchium]|uniref:TetR family transcriptional regulator n=1 Tax=Agromyces bracchium TaxID=88376 RepID=A0A6I3M5H3_9MICO|nr:TetR family transcriptional regulator [Agromyces bracchium]MTH69870.1 TetR family transcriptional regulator [Agromyces bracchium]